MLVPQEPGQTLELRNPPLLHIVGTINGVAALARHTLNGSANGSNGQKITPQPNEAGLPGKRVNRDAQGRIHKLSAPAAMRRRTEKVG